MLANAEARRRRTTVAFDVLRDPHAIARARRSRHGYGPLARPIPNARSRPMVTVQTRCPTFLKGAHRATLRSRLGITLAALAAAATAVTRAEADNIDPFTYLQSHYTYSQAVPAHPGWGHIKGATGFNNGAGFAILYDGGNLSLFNDGQTEPYTSFTTGGNTGVTQINPSYGGELAVTNEQDVLFYNLDSSAHGGRSTQSTSLRDITYDAQRDRIIVSRAEGIGVLNADGSISHLVGE